MTPIPGRFNFLSNLMLDAWLIGNKQSEAPIL
jgi:hypothetical protein